VTLDIIKIEDFFAAKFEPLDASLSEIRHLTSFDGYAHWRVLLDEEKQLLHFTADKDIWFSAFPTLEMGVYCSGLHISSLTGGGMVLILRPQGVQHSQNLLAITKTAEGRFSLSTTLGQIPNNELGEISHGWFNDDNS